jgi:hypothetical protein
MKEISKLQFFNQFHFYRRKMKQDINIQAVIGLAIATAMLRLSYDNDTTFDEFKVDDVCDEVAEIAIDYIKWVGVDTNGIEIDIYTIAQSFWGMDLDDELDALEEEDYDDEEFEPA